MITERQKKLLNVACECLEIFGGYIIEDRDISKLLEYDGADQDVGCLADDIRIEFDLEDLK